MLRKVRDRVFIFCKSKSRKEPLENVSPAPELRTYLRLGRYQPFVRLTRFCGGHLLYAGLRASHGAGTIIRVFEKARSVRNQCCAEL